MNAVHKIVLLVRCHEGKNDMPRLQRIFALSGDRVHFQTAEAEIMLDLDHRSELLDEWLAVSSEAQKRTPSPRCLRAGRAVRDP